MFRETWVERAQSVVPSDVGGVALYCPPPLTIGNPHSVAFTQLTGLPFKLLILVILTFAFTLSKVQVPDKGFVGVVGVTFETQLKLDVHESN